MATSVSRAYTANRKVTSLSPNVKYQLRKYLTKRCSLKEHSFSVCQVDFIGAFKQKEACPLHFHYHLPLSHPFFWSLLLLTPWASQVARVVKNPPTNAGYTGSIPGSGRFPWRRKWQPASVFLPGKFHRQRSLVGYSPWGHKELDTTERLTLSLSLIPVSTFS